MKKLSEFKPVEPEKLPENYIRSIADDWMLVTAGDREKFNTMTASWGGVGYLWNKPVVFVFIRPQRYTFQFMEEKEHFTLSFFSETYRKALTLCGRVSGREVDKVKESGLTPAMTEAGNITFGEARLVLECRKLYSEFLRPEAFLDPQILPQVYPGEDFHKLYVAEIVHAWRKEYDESH